MARAEVLDAVEELLRNAATSNVDLDREARRVYEWLVEERIERGVERAIRKEERELRSQGLRIGNRREYRRQWVAAAKKHIQSYGDWKFQIVE